MTTLLWTIFHVLVFPGLLFCVVVGLLLAGLDRKLVARMQNRVGPPLLQPWYSKRNIAIGCDRPFDDLLCSPRLPEALAEGFSFLEPYYRYFAALCPEEPAP